MTSNPESKSMNIKPIGEKKKKTWTSPNQRASTWANIGNPHETTPKPNHPKNRNPTKHPTHPLPNQIVIKEISNTTTS